ncbi:uncharacterized protein LOC131667602 isoform X1 [Phymastichus coffea]|uniref:uncharacterized protein LOC131667602 isoform X1 n=1 Tax=Phymastichus coffea TaxID=108790 RepID=UPI00273B914D|nr:uncharacterized protein LOC131667602 isoform X1 [Phymastichus coffea]
MLRIDRETGEELEYEMSNAETGEPEPHYQSPNRKKPFKIPIQETENQSIVNSSREKKIWPEFEPVPTGVSFGETKPICLLLPAIVYCRWLLGVLALIEWLLHVYAHRKNKCLSNENAFFFRSPFHAITSQFCAVCQNETCMNVVGKIQQNRMHKFFKQCHYIKRVVQ